MKSLPLALVILAVSASACAREPTGPVYRAVLRTDQTSYFAPILGTGDSSRALRVILQYSNQSGSPIYLGHCGGDTRPLLGMQPIDSDGIPVGSSEQVAFACAGTAALTLAPSAVRTDTFFIGAPASLPASMRFFYLASSCATFMGTCPPLLPEADRVSAPVRIVAAP